jgi:hypothetical protein
MKRALLATGLVAAALVGGCEAGPAPSPRGDISAEVAVAAHVTIKVLGMT